MSKALANTILRTTAPWTEAVAVYGLSMVEGPMRSGDIRAYLDGRLLTADEARRLDVDANGEGRIEPARGPVAYLQIEGAYPAPEMEEIGAPAPAQSATPALLAAQGDARGEIIRFSFVTRWPVTVNLLDLQALQSRMLRPGRSEGDERAATGMRGGRREPARWGAICAEAWRWCWQPGIPERGEEGELLRHLVAHCTARYIDPPDPATLRRHLIEWLAIVRQP
jgi:hypothetical protein